MHFNSPDQGDVAQFLFNAQLSAETDDESVIDETTILETVDDHETTTNADYDKISSLVISEWNLSN